MHVLFLAPETHVYNHGFVRGLKRVGARVSAIGVRSRAELPQELKKHLDGYLQVQRLFEIDEPKKAASELGKIGSFDRIETIDEPLIEPAALLREALAVPGLSSRTAKLCRDKAAMKEFLRKGGIPCAESAAASTKKPVHAFAEKHGYPLILKPIAGFGSLNTHRVENSAELERGLESMQKAGVGEIAVEEFIEGHEGFYDTITDDKDVRHEFVSHYFPGCLEAAQSRWISPQIAVTNRITSDGYKELRRVGRKVVQLLGLSRSATHMEWFFGPKGLKFSEIGARPAGEKIWDMYAVANEFDVYREWALAIVGRPSAEAPSRKFAAGSIQVRPDRDGRVAAHFGLDAVWKRCHDSIYESAVPKPGSPTQPLDKGGLVNTWFRLRHPDYDELLSMMDFIGETVSVRAE